MTEFAPKRLDKARRALAAARREADAGNPDFAVDHAYYAMFYAAEALLAFRDLRYRSHGAVHGAFGQYFVKSGELDASHHRALLDAFEARQAATYGVDTAFTAEEAIELIARAEAFVTAVTRRIAPRAQSE